jgi:hypothetical protein
MMNAKRFGWYMEGSDGKCRLPFCNRGSSNHALKALNKLQKKILIVNWIL